MSDNLMIEFNDLTVFIIQHQGVTNRINNGICFVKRFADGGEPQVRPLPEFMMFHLADGNTVTFADASDNALDDLPLILQRG